MKNFELKIEALNTEKVIISFANKDHFHSMLEIIAHSYNLDMLVVYKQIIDDDCGDGGITTRIILKAEVEEAGLTIKELDDIARKNTSKLFPAIITDFAGMMIITNTVGICGASAILYSNLVRQIADKFQSDLYLLPSSIHEFIALPVNDFIGTDFSDIIRTVNGEFLEPKEVLSSHAYYYDRAKGVIRIA